MSLSVFPWSRRSWILDEYSTVTYSFNFRQIWSKGRSFWCDDNSIYGIYRNKIIVKLNVLSNSKGIQLCIVHEYILRRNIIPITFDNIGKHFIQTKLRLSHTSKDDPHGKQWRYKYM
jgi:hypothetical protein